MVCTLAMRDSDGPNCNTMGPTAQTTHPPSHNALDRARIRSLQAARKLTKKPATSIFIRTAEKNTPATGSAGSVDTADDAQQALTKISQRRLKTSQKLVTGKPTCTILHRETAAVTKTRIHSSFQPRKDGSISHRRIFLSSVQPLSDTIPREPILDTSPPIVPDFEYLDSDYTQIEVDLGLGGVNIDGPTGRKRTASVRDFIGH